jgi:hypothetical protein
LTILAFVMGGVYSVFKVAHDGIDRVDRRTALTQTGRVLLSDLSRELASMYPLEIDLSSESGATALSGAGLAGAQTSQTLITFVGEDLVDADGRDVDNLRFTTAATDPRRRYSLLSQGWEGGAGEEGLNTAPSYDLAEVLYYVDDDDTTPERGLVRQSNELPGLATEEVVPDVQEISEYVIGMNLRYLDDSEEEPEWVDQWEDTTQLPAALELTLFLTPDPEVRDLDTAMEHGRVVSTVVRLPIRTPIVPVGAAGEGATGTGGAGEPGNGEAGPSGEEGPEGLGGGGFPGGGEGSGFPGGDSGGGGR